MEIRYKINPKILVLALFGFVMMFTSYLMFVYDPLHIIIKKVLALGPGSIFYGIWTDPPYKVYVNVYIFNVTNGDDFLYNNATLEFEELGPYVYQEMLTNENATFNDNGTVSYYPKRRFAFVREKSVGDPEKDRILSPNIPLIGISASLQEAGLFTNLALTTISNVLNSKPLLNITVQEYLWGYDDRLVTLANEAIPSWINFERFGIMDRLLALDNADNYVTITTSPIKAKPDNPLMTEEEKNRPYYIQQFNGSPGLKHWGYVDTVGNETNEANSRCNLMAGAYDGTLFPPDLDGTQDFKLYRRAFCRPVPVLFDKQVISKDGFDGMRYVVKPDFLAAPEENPENACYCVKGKCLPKGLSSISPCYYDIPITLSQPHFYNAAPELLTQVGGMKPNKTLHDSHFILHKNIGVPLEAYLRIQINLDVGQTKYNSRIRRFNGLHLPLFWLEMTVEEPPTIIWVCAKFLYQVLPIIQEIVKFLFALGGAAMVSGSALLVLFSTRDQGIPVNSPILNSLPFTRFSLRRSSEYAPIPVINIPSQYFKPEIRIGK